MTDDIARRGDEPVDAERALMDGLFSQVGRADPQAVLRSSTVPGCRYSFVEAVLHDPRFVAPRIPPSQDLMFQVVARFLARLEPERHRAIRGHFAGLFTPRRVEQYRSRITQRVEALLDAFPAAGPVDLVADFARPLPFSVIADVLGVPAQDQPWLTHALEAFARAVAGQRDRAEVELGNAATAEMLEYFDAALRRREGDPGDDLLSTLASGAPAGKVRDDVLANCVFFVLAGHATTTTLLAAGVDLLLEHPAQLDRLRTHPRLWPSAVEEMLRYVSPTTLTGATAREDAEVDGCPVAAGAQRALVFAAANRDPAVFEHPDRFDVTRAPNPHLAFSAGAHYCLGAPLTRMHAQLALPALFERFPRLRRHEPVVWLGSAPIRQVGSFLVSW